MSTPRFTDEELDRLRELAAEWGKIVSKRAFGDDGPGLDVDFTTMEQIATVAAQGLAFVEMVEGAEEAIQALNQARFGNRSMTVNEAKPREDRPSGAGRDRYARTN